MKKIIFLLYYILVPLILSGQSSRQISMASEWRFDLDSTDVGEKEEWFNTTLSKRINLPGITDEGGYGEEVIEKGKMSRLHKYIGKAWYQTDIMIPSIWGGKNVALQFERVMWKSKLWVDGRFIGSEESLSTPHQFDLGKLTPGKHTITLSIDSREIYPIAYPVGNPYGHNYGEQTQIIWNGVLGKIELGAFPDVALGQIRTFPDSSGEIGVEFNIQNRSNRQKKAVLSVTIKEKNSGEEVKSAKYHVKVPAGGMTLQKTEQVASPKLWDEFSPNLYTLETRIECNGEVDRAQDIDFGFRTLAKTADFITVNGIPRFLRGNLDCALFPLTGYPPTDKESWLTIFKQYKIHGFNHVRFHSWTPPKAAFEAADELGLYILTEIMWRDGWMGKRLDVNEVEPFVRPELRRIVDNYGNHPSLIAVAIGNEMGGFDLNLMDPWIKEVKEYDPRPFYSVSVRRPPTKSADINFQGDLSSPYPLLFINEGRLRTDWDYAQWYGDSSSLPSIQHEVGQWTFYPDWRELDKYTGNLRPRGLESYKEMAIKNGVYAQNSEFVRSSSKQALLLYKENVESILRTPRCGGFQLLSMQDFSGQGEALIGWLDAFHESKEVVEPEEILKWNNTTVPLMRTESYIYTNEEVLSVDLEVLHFSNQDIQRAVIDWKLTNGQGEVIKGGIFEDCDIRNAQLNKIGNINAYLGMIRVPEQLLLTVSVRDTPFTNDWNFWVFPREAMASFPDYVVETHSLEEAVASMEAGETVFLWAYNLGADKNTGYAHWKPTFWRASGYGNDGFTNGAVVRNDHPSLSKFPTGDYLNFQWHDICAGGRGFDLAGLSFSVRPIVQPIHDFHFNRKLGSMMEFKGMEGGKIFICGYNLVDSLHIRPAANALRKSLIDYVAATQFEPEEILDYDWLKLQLRNPADPYDPPAQFEGAYLYVKAGARYQQNGKVKWSSDMDGATSFETDKYGYDLFCDNVIVDGGFSAWQGKEIQLAFKMPFDYQGDILVNLSNRDSESQQITTLFNGKETLLELAPSSGETIIFSLKKGDSLLGKIDVFISSLSSQDVMVEEIALMPSR